MKDLIKKYGIHGIAILIFLLVAIVRFYPQLQGKTINQSDVTSAVAMQQEAQAYNATHDDITYWTNNMFGGMPSYTIWAPTFNGMQYFTKILLGGFGPPIGFFFMAMLCFYFLVSLFGVRPWIGILSAMVFAYYSGNVILWEAGHTNKLLTVANASLIIASLYVSYHKRMFWSAALLMAFSMALNILSGHIQMTYYLFLSMLILTLLYFIRAFRKKELLDFLKSSLALSIGVIVALMISYSSLSVQYSFKKDTMRGAPILKNVSSDKASSSSETEGLEWNYAMQWSNGPLDMLSLVVPLAAGGGSSESVRDDSKIKQLIRRNGGNTRNLKLPYYFGSLPFTAGAIYFGVLVFVFFFIGCYSSKGPIGWWLISSTIFIFLLSMGKHLSWINLPIFKYLPLYNSFRAPSSALIVAYLPVVFGAALGLQHLIESKHLSKKAFSVSVGVLSIICLMIGFVLPEMIDFSGSSDSQIANAGIDINLFNDDRKAMMRSDSLRSLAFLGMASLLFFVYVKNKIPKQYFSIALALLMVWDVVPVGYRYLNKDSWVTKRNNEQAFVPRAVDTQIMNNEPHRGAYRVLDLSINTFNSSITSYHHNTIGGYNAAKLQRYQDLIDRHISQNNMKVLNMLNTKYIIDREQKVQLNSQALGNAWFVDDIMIVSTPEEEINALNDVDPAQTAVYLASEFDNDLNTFNPVRNQGDQITLTSYSPKELIYKYNAASDQFVVFSEIWYGPDKGWKSYIDDVEVEHVRVNYTLRGMKVPAGNHTIRYVFEPQLIARGILISKIGTSILMLGLVLFLFLKYRGKLIKNTND